MSNVRPVSGLRNNNDETIKAKIKLMTHLQESEKSAREEGWISMDDIEAALEL